MKLFADGSVALAGSLPATGASRLIFEIADAQGWTLFVSPWVLREVRDNLAGKPPSSPVPGSRSAQKSSSKMTNSPSTGRSFST